MNNQVLLTYYIKYLKEIRKVSDSSVSHYTQALRKISSILVERGKIEESIYEIQDIGELEIIREYLFNDADFIELNQTGHQMYSSGLNNYYKFATGEGFSNIHKKIEILDGEMPIAEMSKREVISRPRSSIIKLQSIESAGYLCEYDNTHVTFTSKSTGHPYMEGHHALPMKYQDKFDYSLDIYANVVCLCPICHRLLHHGIESEKQVLVDKIYFERAERLAVSGIKISKEDFKQLVV